MPRQIGPGHFRALTNSQPAGRRAVTRWEKRRHLRGLIVISGSAEGDYARGRRQFPERFRARSAPFP